MLRHRKRTLSVGLAAALLAGSGITNGTSGATPSVVSGSLVVSGHGWGHGNGMGQYGALGYALDHGWTSSQILGHYYGGTTAGSVSPSSEVTVQIRGNDGQPLLAQVASAGLVVMGDGGSPIPLAGQAARIERVGTDRFRVSDAQTCAGPWTVRRDISSTQVRLRAADIGSGGTRSFGFGVPSDVPLSGDWNDDGVDTVGVRRGSMFLLRNTSSAGPADLSFGFGLVSDEPLVGDWDGDGVDTVGVRRGNAFYLRNTNSAGPADLVIAYGRATDEALVGDWDGDGTDSIGVRRGSTFMLSNQLDAHGEITFSYGRPTDESVIGNWDATGGDSIGVRRGSQWHLRNPLAGGTADFFFTFGSGAGRPLSGAWTGGASFVGEHEGSQFLLATSHEDASPLQLATDDEPLERTLQLCQGTTRTWYRGELRAASEGTAQRTVNAVALDQYLRGVLPREMPASWGSMGDGRGMAALEAQAVAARSYAVTQNREPYAKTCDTASCQVYGGRARQVVGGDVTVTEHPNSDAAIQRTAGGVRMGGGKVVATEYSSSTGGVTSGRTFPSVRDDGDDIYLNPNHFWVVSIPHTSLESRYGQRGFQSAEVTGHTSGDGGRRATQVRLTFASGVVQRTGAQFKADWDLRETWFDLGAAQGSDTVGVRDVGGPTFRLNDLPISGTPRWSFIFGTASDLPVAGDWNGDGIDSPGIFRDGTFHLRNANSGGGADVVVAFGAAGDVPLVGDWNGDEVDTVGYRRGRNFAIRNSNALGAPEQVTTYGTETDVPVVGDWDGDDRDSFGIFRAGTFHLTDSITNATASYVIATGRPGRPVVGDWDGDGTDNVGVLEGGRFTLFVVNDQRSKTLTIDFAAGLPLAGRWG